MIFTKTMFKVCFDQILLIQIAEDFDVYFTIRYVIS